MITIKNLNLRKLSKRRIRKQKQKGKQQYYPKEKYQDLLVLLDSKVQIALNVILLIDFIT